MNAATAGDNERYKFDLGPITFKCSVVVTKGNEIGGGVKVWVLNANGSHKSSNASTQELSFVLNPIDTHDVTGKTRVKGRALPGE